MCPIVFDRVIDLVGDNLQKCGKILLDEVIILQGQGILLYLTKMVRCSDRNEDVDIMLATCWLVVDVAK